MIPKKPSAVSRQEALEQAVAFLMEWFDAVQIFGCWDSNDFTMMEEDGGGNQLTRERHVQRWLMKVDEKVRQAAREDCQGDEDDDLD